jgi:hypothetical protein
LTSHFKVIAQMWLALFPESLQMVLELPSNARSYDGHDEDVRSLREGVCNHPVLYWKDE